MAGSPPNVSVEVEALLLPKVPALDNTFGCVLIGTLVAFVTALRKTTTPGHLELVHLCQYDVTRSTFLCVIPLAMPV